eukprot:1872348-Prymnesium_polylepis.2
MTILLSQYELLAGRAAPEWGQGGAAAGRAGLATGVLQCLKGRLRSIPGATPGPSQFVLRRGIPKPLGTVCRSARDPPCLLPVQTPATGRGGSPATRSRALGIGGNRGGGRRSRPGDASAHETA